MVWYKVVDKQYCWRPRFYQTNNPDFIVFMAKVLGRSYSFR